MTDEITRSTAAPHGTGYLASASRIRAQSATRRPTAISASLLSKSANAACGDFEAFWAPAVELQLESGDLISAQRMFDLSGALLVDFPRPLLLAEVPRLRGLIALAYGEDPEADLREAERLHAAFGTVFLLARTRLELGRWLQRQGRPEEAAQLLSEARATFVRLRAQPSIAEVDAVAPRPVVAGA